MIVILYGICALLSICLNAKELPQGLTRVYLNANNPRDMEKCPPSRIVPTAHVPFKNINDVENWILTYYSCTMFFVNNEDIKYEEMFKNHDKSVYMEDGVEMTFNQFAKKGDDGHYMVDYLSTIISILKFHTYSISVVVKDELIFGKDFGVGRGKHFMITPARFDFNKKGELIYTEFNTEKHFLNKVLNPSTKRGNAAFQIGFGDQIDNPYGIYILFIIILLLLNLCVLYQQCTSKQKKIKYKKVRNYDVESTETES